MFFLQKQGIRQQASLLLGLSCNPLKVAKVLPVLALQQVGRCQVKLLQWKRIQSKIISAVVNCDEMTWTHASFLLLQNQVLLRFVKICSLPSLSTRLMVLHRKRKTGVLSRPLSSPQTHNNVRASGTLWLLSTLCSYFNCKNKSMHVHLYTYISLSL